MSDAAAAGWALLERARVARLATLAAADGAPHVVPITFACDAARGLIVHAVDHKPKATRALARLANVRADPRASILADHYEEDWSALWWVRADGRAEILEDAPELVDLLVARYPEQYGGEARRPEGPVVALHVERLRSWSA
ncbi:TIGR03668 family PPOX class F420-dependent oxidoreductase [Conexibacter woesei]|uniref:TIGR03668 family PPOX class F420-dependent oxidoreductase n=1 Tax=Conexibacter woesei TaxID=191495 RepID=UPI0004261B93|nr:TIGR03668 family PPOX class F420-dependent oxidoreductase [Conexibacter woesei]